jgi:hypothetical protein
MKKNTIYRIAAFLGFAAVFVVVIGLSAPKSALAWGGYNNYYGGGYGYPYVPSYNTIPSVQVVYANGYYQNYYVPTVRYFPAPSPLPVYTTYYPSQPPVYTYPGYNNFPGYYGGYRHW